MGQYPSSSGCLKGKLRMRTLPMVAKVNHEPEIRREPNEEIGLDLDDRILNYDLVILSPKYALLLNGSRDVGRWFKVNVQNQTADKLGGKTPFFQKLQ